MEQTRLGIDIIVPIYNGFEDLVRCIDSVEKHTDLALDRLILINDMSSDPRVEEYLAQKQSDRIICIHNTQNLGFSNNVNKGMLYSQDRDVILLNSDTIVTAGWTDKIYACAYSREEIATVTPLSNNATLCSVPVMCQENQLPEGISVDEMGEIIERCSLCRYPRITVAVGFCMFIKRQVIRDVGLFDAETFEKGYGEENDFCNRAEQLGYIHVMCDDTFICHVGSVSFLSEEKKQLMAAHEKVLQERYPEQMRKNHLYCVNNPDQYIRDNLNVHLDLHNKKPSLLYLVHFDFREDSFGHVGGTQFHVRDLTMGLLQDYNVFVASRDDDHLRLTVYTDGARHSFRFYIGKPEPYFQYHNARLRTLFDTILDEFQIQCVHIHHVNGLSMDLFDAAHVRDLPLVFTVHDHSFICSIENLMDADGCYCQGRCDTEKSRACLHSRRNLAVTVDHKIKWQAECRRVLGFCDRIVFPSESIRDTMLAVYPELEDKAVVIEHGITIAASEEPESLALSAGEIGQIQGVHYCLDELEIINHAYLKAVGWITFPGADNRQVSLYLAEKQPEGKVRLHRLSKKPRQDVADILQSSLYLSCGFNERFFLETESDASEMYLVLKYRGLYYRGTPAFRMLQVKGLSRLRAAAQPASPRRRIAFLGGMVPAKGSKLALQMIQSAPKDQYEWYLFGILGDEELDNLEQENLYKLGQYRQESLPKLLSRFSIDMVSILSICPESFCYTLSEAIACGVPVMALDMGALGERIRKHGYGWLVPADASSADILAEMDRILNTPEEYQSVRRRAAETQEKTMAEMCRDYDVLYRALPSHNPHYSAFDPALLLGGLQVEDPNGVEEAACNAESAELRKATRLLQEKEQELIAIKNTRSYRLVQKLNRLLGRI